MSYIEKIEKEKKAREHSITLKVFRAIDTIILGCVLVSAPFAIAKVHNATDEEKAILKPSIVKEQHTEIELEDKELEVETLEGQKVKVK